mgnify:FL=1|jgi:hypothetical protein|tara:strand:+ start:1549 stop:1857 length:309 start_codon:yes stop_codon:yes gene_type:complete
MAVDGFVYENDQWECKALGAPMEDLAVVLNQQVKTQIEMSMLHLKCARQELQGNVEIPTSHVASRGARHTIRMIENAEDRLNEMLEKLVKNYPVITPEGVSE